MKAQWGTQVAALGMAALALMAGSVRPAEAQLLVDPSTGTTLTFPNPDDAVVNRTLPGTAPFRFFGTPFTNVGVSTNGNLNFTNNASVANSPFPAIVARIAPLWDDLIFRTTVPASSVVENAAPSYYAVTWNNIGVFGSADARHTFQAVWFGADTTLSGFDFRADDIAFSYLSVANFFSVSGGNANATVGLNRGPGAAVVLPGTTNGIVTSSSQLPLARGFVLFRADEAGGYNASIIPEPGTLALLGTGTVSLLGWRRRRRRRAA